MLTEKFKQSDWKKRSKCKTGNKVLNYEINILTEQEDSERRQLEFKEKTDNIVKNLNLMKL